MTYTSLLVKLLTSTIVATAFAAVPVPVRSTEEAPVNPAPVVVTTTPPVAVVHHQHAAKPQGDCEKYRSIIEKYNWPIETAMQICKDESHGDPTNINWNDKHKDSKGNIICVSSQGLMQVACFFPKKLGYTMDDLLDPEKNIAMAYEIYSSSGFYPWTTYKP